VLFHVVLVLSGGVVTQRKAVNFMTPHRVFIPVFIGTRSVTKHESYGTK